MIRSYFQSQTDFAAYHLVFFVELYHTLYSIILFILRKSRPLAVRALYVSLHNNPKVRWFTRFAVRYYSLTRITLLWLSFPNLTEPPSSKLHRSFH